MKKLPSTKLNSHGFTIMELMISVAIIGILSGLLLVVINPRTFAGRGRDAQRVSDLKAIQAALELYYTDFRAYPASGGWITSDNATFRNALQAGYISAVPVDPVNTGSTTTPCSNVVNNHRYYYRSNSSSYVMASFMEFAQSNNGHECNTATLTRWGSVAGCAVTGAALDFCYGVQSPQ